METFTEPKDLAVNPNYKKQRQESLAEHADVVIDGPIIEMISGFNELPYCFTLQSCHGHFLYKGHEDPCNLDPLPVTNTIDIVEYKIAYIVFCI